MFFALGRFGGGLVLGRTTFRVLTALVESSADTVIALGGSACPSARVVAFQRVAQFRPRLDYRLASALPFHRKP
jgi:hypothetical protein